MESKRTATRRRRLEVTAYHEAGHVVAHISHNLRFRLVTIEPGMGDLGHVLKRRLPRPILMRMKLSPKMRDRLDREVLACLAGLAAESHFTGRKDFRGAGGDIEAVEALASIVYSGDVLTKYIAFKFAEAGAFVRVRANWVRIQALAAKLAERKTLTESDARAVYDEAFRVATSRAARC